MDITLTPRARKVKAQRAIFHLYFDYIEHFGGSIRIGSLLRLTTALGLTDNAARAAVCRLAKQGWLERTTHAKHSFYALTPVAHERIKEALPRVFAPRNGHWDGQWTILTYSVPEKLRHYRSRLRRELTWLGYGQLNPATWINPHPVTDMTLRHLSLRRLDCYVHLFRSHQVSGQPHSALVERCFNLRSIEKHYRSFIEVWSPVWSEHRARAAAGDPLPNNSCFALQRHLLYEYGNFLIYGSFLAERIAARRLARARRPGPYSGISISCWLRPRWLFSRALSKGPPEQKKIGCKENSDYWTVLSPVGASGPRRQLLARSPDDREMRDLGQSHPAPSFARIVMVPRTRFSQCFLASVD